MLALVVDDHALIRDALRGVLNTFDEIGEIVEAATARDADRMLEDMPSIGLVLLDLALPDRSGVSLLRTLRTTRPQVTVVMLSASEDRTEMSQALEAGAAGFIPKSATRDVMRGALKLIFAGGIYVPPEILSTAVRRPEVSSSPTPVRVDVDLALTDRQMEVLHFMMHGMSNKAICRALDIAEPTVKNHVTAILRALGANNRTEAVVAASALGISITDADT